MRVQHLFERARRAGFGCLAVGIAVLGVVGILSGGSVSADTGLKSTTPADGSTVFSPLTEIEVAFTAPTTMSEEGFVVLRSDGTPMVPIQIDTVDGTVYTMVFNPGLQPGTYGVRWSVMSQEEHSLTGTFQFDVEVAPTTTAAPTTTDPDATTVPETTTGSSEAASSTTTVATTIAEDTTGSTDVDATTTTPTTSPEFAELLANDEPGGVVLTRIGHLLRFGATIFAIGALVALVSVLRSDKHDLFVTLNAVRMAGLVIVLGAALEWAEYQSTTGVGLGAIFDTRIGLAAVLCWVGGVLMLFGLTERRSLEPIAGDLRWRPGFSSAAGLVGAMMVLLSFGFDADSAVRGPQLLKSAADIAHVAAAAVWAGGVAALAMVAWLRRRRGQHARVGHAVVRFSPIAALSLTAVALTGVALAAMIVSAPGAAIDSPWGRTLLVKIVVVSIAVVAGGFNRFVLLPEIDRDPDSADTSRRVRFALTVEAVVFAIVVIISTVLVTLDAAA